MLNPKNKLQKFISKYTILVKLYFYCYGVMFFGLANPRQAPTFYPLPTKSRIGRAKQKEPSFDHNQP